MAFATGSLVDEATGKPVENATVRVDRPAAFARIASGGFFCVSGSMAKVMPVIPTALTLTFAADRYQPRVVPIPIGAVPVFPISGGTVRLRPLPVRFEGRVTREADRSGIANANVTLKSPTNAVLLRTPAHIDHASGVTITPTTLGLVAPLRSVKDGVRSGADVVKLDNVALLAVNAILGFGAGPVEYAVIDSVDAGASTVTLKSPLRRSYANGAAVQERNSTPGVGAAATTRSIDEGDGLVLLTAAMTAASIEISDPPRLEYHDTNLVADAEGFFAVDGVAGPGAITLTGSSGTFVPLDLDIIIDYSRPVAVLGFRLKTP